MELLESLLAIFGADHAITGELKPHHEDTSDRVTSDLPNVSANITAGLRRVLGAGGS